LEWSGTNLFDEEEEKVINTVINNIIIKITLNWLKGN
jgi:hypothetical protein